MNPRRLRRAPLSEIPALLAALEQWTNGTARDVALALLHARQSPELVDAPAGEKPVSRYRTLAAALAAALAEVVREAAVLDFSTVTPVPDKNLELLARVARSMGESPGREALLSEIFRRKPMIFDNPGETEITPESNPEHALAIAAMLERLTRESPDQAISVLKDGMPNLKDEGNVAALTAAAPRILPQLCRRGHVKEAVQLLDRTEDRGAWRESFQAVLPYWMDADPVAARAAFEAAPLTALERERWQRHPAFLLHP